MHKKVIKLLGALTITLLIVMTPIMVLATNEGVSVVNTQTNEYIIYIRITQTKILSMHLQIMQVQKKWIYLILIQSQIWEEAKEHF